MAKRMISTNKWKNPHYRKVPSKFKLAWDYIYLDCDCAGIWQIDMDMLCFSINEKITIDELQKVFGDNIVLLNNDKLILGSFFEDQYGDTKDNFNAKIKAVSLLKEQGVEIINNRVCVPPHSPHTPPTVGYVSPTLTLTLTPTSTLTNTITEQIVVVTDSPIHEHPIDTPIVELDPDLINRTGKPIKAGTPVSIKKPKFDIEALYQAYPRKEGKKRGIAFLEKKITSQEIYDNVLTAIRNYSSQCEGKEKQFIKQFSSFATVWEDYLEVNETENEQDALIAAADSRPFHSWIDEAKENGQL